MKFGPVPIERSVGAIAAHGVRAEGVLIKKGDRVRPDQVEGLRTAAIPSLVVAELEPGDVDENAAAHRLAEALVGAGVRLEPAFTGRANIFALQSGILLLDPAAVDTINAVDESITLATLPPFRTVQAGEMVATVKIIPFAVPGSALDAVLSRVKGPPIAVRAFRPMRVGVISTLLPGLKPSVVNKTLRVLADRLAPAGARIVADERVPHEVGALAQALRRLTPIDCDIDIVFGASAIADRRDVIPAAIVEAGGIVRHLGMPVDPGNLLLTGSLDGKPVLGAPGCARSPRENGFDWVLHRLLAGLDVTPDDIRRLGTGGLLMEIVSRPQPREADASADHPGPAEAGG